MTLPHAQLREQLALQQLVEGFAQAGGGQVAEQANAGVGVQALAAGADGSLYILADGALLKATLEP